MTNPFDVAIDDIYADTDFTATATIGSASVTVIASEITDAPVLGEFGIDSGISFFIRCKVSDLVTEPKQNDLITYNATQYRVEHVSIDSVGKEYKIYLKSKSSR